MQADVLFLVIPVMTVVIACTLLVLWWKDRQRLHILAFAYWAGAFSLGTIFQGLLRWNFPPFDIVLFHLNAAIAITALIWGVLRRDEIKFPASALIVLMLGSTVLLAFARYLEDQSALLMTQNFTISLMFTIAAICKWQVVPRNPGDRMVLWVFAALAAYSFFRPAIMLLVQSSMTMADYQASIFATVNLTLSALFALLIGLSVLATIIFDNMERQREEARMDPLSGLRLRRAFEEDVDTLKLRSLHSGVPISLIVCDIDHFKRINDGWGHAVGDIVISDVGALIKRTIRETDIAGRIGGEEFCIMVWNCEISAATKLAERLRRSTAELNAETSGQSLKVTCSFGVAQLRYEESYASLFERADAALYQAKEAGRNRVVQDGIAPRTEERRAHSEPISLLG